MHFSNASSIMPMKSNSQQALKGGVLLSLLCTSDSAEKEKMEAEKESFPDLHLCPGQSIDSERFLIAHVQILI
jgi:hypothetical protein